MLGCNLAPDDVVITSGGQEALTLALQSVCRPGDTVAVESPMYYGLLQIFECLQLRALEIPTCPTEGMSVEALRFALQHHRPGAVLLIPNFNNPLGFRMPEADKRAVVSMLAQAGVPLIEDDVYGDLQHDDGERARPCREFDTTGSVILCSSFSKTIAPGFRVGWMAPGRYRHEVIRRKSTLNLATATLPQLTIAAFLEEGGYDHHLRGVRRALRQRMDWALEAVAQSFPAGTAVTRPAGGFTMWVELPGGQDTLALYGRAIAAGMTFMPGTLFSAQAGYRHCLRLNTAFVSDATLPSLCQLGELAHQSANPYNQS
jgi:DNA-binding transcriptional MocR family regulator